MNKSNIKNIITALLALVIQYAVSFFISPVIVSNLGASANGYAQLANNFVTYASLITISFNSMASRFMSINYHRGYLNEVSAYYSSVGIVNLLITFIIIPLAVWMIVDLNHIIVIEAGQENDVKILFACVFANFIMTLATSILTTAFFVLNKIYLQNLLTLIANCVRALIIVLLFRFFPPKLFFVSLTALILTILITPFNLQFKAKNLPWLRISRGAYRKDAVFDLLKSGIWNTVNQCGHMLMTGMDLLLSNLFITPDAMGILSVSKTFPAAISAVVASVNNSFTAALTEKWAKNDTEAFLSELRVSMKISSVVLSIPLSVFIAFSVPFYHLWMPTLDARELAVLSFLSVMQFIPWTGPAALFNVFTAANKLKVNAVSFVISGILNVSVVFFYISHFSNGIYIIAGVSSAITIIRNVFITAPYTARIIGIKWFSFYKDMGLSVVCCAIVFCVSSLAGFIVHSTGWISLFCGIILSCIISFFFLIMIVLKKDERSKLISVFTRRA